MSDSSAQGTAPGLRAAREELERRWTGRMARVGAGELVAPAVSRALPDLVELMDRALAREEPAPERAAAALGHALPDDEAAPLALWRSLQALRDAALELLAERGAAAPEARALLGDALASVAVGAGAHALGRARAEAALAAGDRARHQAFMRQLAHELRTPLNAVSLSLQLFERALDEVGRQRALDAARRSLRQLEAMSLNLLDANRVLSDRPLPLQLEPLDLLDVCQAVCRDLEAHTWRDRCRVEGPSVHGWWGGHAVRRLLTALIDNALRYGSWQSPVTVRLIPRGERVTVEVHNHGKPLSPERQRALLAGRLQPTEEGSTPGRLGVGLLLARGLAEAHHGRLSVRSDADGTTFSVDLPRDTRLARSRRRAA